MVYNTIDSPTLETMWIVYFFVFVPSLLETQAIIWKTKKELNRIDTHSLCVQYWFDSRWRSVFWLRALPYSFLSDLPNGKFISNELSVFRHYAYFKCFSFKFKWLLVELSSNVDFIQSKWILINLHVKWKKKKNKQ